MRVLIVDDHPIVISGCRSILESDPSLEVFEASDGTAGYSGYFAGTPDCHNRSESSCLGWNWFAAFVARAAG